MTPENRLGKGSGGGSTGGLPDIVEISLGAPHILETPSPELTMRQLLATPNIGRVEFYPDGALRSIEFQTPPKPEKGKASVPGELNSAVVPIRREPEVAGTV